MDQRTIIEAMERRMAALEKLLYRDYTGGLHDLNNAYREVKYWKEAIERGEFDGPVEGVGDGEKGLKQEN